MTEKYIPGNEINLSSRWQGLQGLGGGGRGEEVGWTSYYFSVYVPNFSFWRVNFPLECSRALATFNPPFHPIHVHVFIWSILLTKLVQSRCKKITQKNWHRSLLVCFCFSFSIDIDIRQYSKSEAQKISQQPIFHHRPINEISHTYYSLSLVISLEKSPTTANDE